jgi:L-fucose mutarotase
VLKGIDQRLTAEVVHALMRMGHGDDLLLCDVNHPAASIAHETVTGRVLDLAGCDIPVAARAILALMPLDTFVPAPVARMEVVGDPGARPAVVDRLQAVLDAAEGRAVAMRALERFAFYAEARRAFVVVRTGDSGPYGCFLLKKGVVDLPPLG